MPDPLTPEQEAEVRDEWSGSHYEGAIVRLCDSHEQVRAESTNTTHDLHCDCRIELLKVAEERDAARKDAAWLSEALRSSDLERERQRAEAAAQRDAGCNGACSIAEAVTQALMDVGEWDEIDGDGTPETVLADHIRALPHRLTELAGDVCLDDPDGLHHVGCGCEAV